MGIQIYVDFRGLNDSCPMILSNFKVLSCMDGSPDYNQIKIALEYEKHTSFRTQIEIFCYTVMPFGLKNTSAMHQSAMTKIFDDLMHKLVECYTDDLVVKS